MVRALSQLTGIEEELKKLRNALEEMRYERENSDRRQQDAYQDLDSRLLALERNAEQASELAADDQPLTTASQQVLSEGQTGGQTDARDFGQRGEQDDSVDSGEQQLAAVAPPYNPADIAGTRGVTVTEQEAYDNAFETLKQSRYEDAIEEFQTIVNTWPDSDLADDSLYWMSEANYVNRKFEVALNGFEDLVLLYPDSSRIPEAMLKIGYIQYDIGSYDKAADTFQDILSRFPDHQVTASAETRLRRIQQTIQ